MIFLQEKVMETVASKGQEVYLYGCCQIKRGKGMKHILPGFFMVAAIVMAASFSMAQQVPASRDDMRFTFAPLVKKTSPAVVNIYTKVKVKQRVVSPFFNDPFFSQFFNMPGFGGGTRERIENALGSGVIVDSSGVIATNNHVVGEALEIRVVMNDGREFSAEKILSDSKTDLAILKIDAKGEKLPVLELGDSDALEVGDLVLAIGNPFGVGQTVTSGIISGLARTGIGSDYSFFIQTDAAINPGNSGGALIDMHGRLVGINSMIFSRDGGSLGIGFAIPAGMVKSVIEASRHGGKIVRPWSGVTGQGVTADMAEALGLTRARGTLVNKVHPKGPAAKAGLKPGDVILAVDGKEVPDPGALKYRFAMVPIGTEVTLSIWRKKKEAALKLVTAAAIEEPARDEAIVTTPSPLSGATVANISPAVGEELGGLPVEEGVVVLNPGTGNAARLGITPGDIVLGVNGAEVKSVRQLVNLLSQQKNRRWQVQLQRGGQMLNLVITL